MPDNLQLTLYAIIVATNSVYSLASLFLPTVFEEKEISGWYVGLVFAFYAIAQITVSPFVGKLLKRVSYANVITFGLFCMGCSIVPIAFVKQIESNTYVVMLTVLLRFMQGTASASINSTCFSLAADKYPDQTEYMVGMLEAVSAIGLVIGLMGGASLYETMGY
jgi:MFS family permease